MKLYIVKGIHFSEPARPMLVHATMDSANAAAAELVNDLLEWVELPRDATAENWQERREVARQARCEEMGVEIDPDSLDEDPIAEALGEDNGDVWIEEDTLRGVGLIDYRAREIAGVDAREWKVKIEVEPDSIQIHAAHPDNPGVDRSIWIEINDHLLVAHCYDPAHEEPLNVRIGDKGILVDHDR